MTSPREVLEATTRGLLWSATATVGGRIVSFASLAILARILAPQDFGLVAFALVVITYLETVGDLGTRMALVYWPERSRDVAQLTFVVNLVAGFLWLGVTWVAAPFVADFLGSPEGEDILRALAWVLPLKALGATHDALLQRELRFRARAFPELALMCGKAAVAVPLAAFGFGAWSLVWGQLAGQAAWTALVWSSIPWRPSRGLPRDLVRPVLRYGGGIVAVNVIAAIVHHADVVVVGGILGTVALGFYQMAYRVPDVAVTLLVRVVSSVLFPAMSRLNDARTDLGELYLSALRYVSLLAVPGSVGLALLAEPLVLTLFGAEWRPSVPILQVLAAYTGLRALGSCAGDVLKATGRPHLLAAVGAFRAVALVPLLVFAAGRGPVAVSLALMAETALSTAVYLVIGARIARASAGPTAAAVRPALLAAVPMALFLLLLTGAEALPAPAVLCVGTLGGAAFYGATLLLVAPSVRRDVAALFDRCCRAARPRAGAVRIQPIPERSLALGRVNERRKSIGKENDMTDGSSIQVELTDRELKFLRHLTRDDDYFITEDEEEARLHLRDKLFRSHSPDEVPAVVVDLTRDELLFLMKISRENYSFVKRAEKEARLALAGKLHRCAESVFRMVAND